MIVTLSALFLIGSTQKPQQAQELWMAPGVKLSPLTFKGPFIRSGDGKILSVYNKTVKISDDGLTWVVRSAWKMDEMKPSQDKGLVVTKDGTLVSVFLDYNSKKYGWDKNGHRPQPGNILKCYTVRSTDNGKTWSTPNPIFTNGYCGQVRSVIQTANGRLVAMLQNLDECVARQVTFAMYSDDDGKTWRKGAEIDIGGTGLTDGILESSVIETEPNKILMIGRTSRDELWQARSSNGGETWTDIKGMGIPASSSPPSILKLQDNTILLVYNQVRSEDGSPPVTRSGENSAMVASWFREEASLRYSKDGGRSWSKPKMFARLPGGQLAYITLFEVSPGLVWAFSGVSAANMEITVSDFVK